MIIKIMDFVKESITNGHKVVLVTLQSKSSNAPGAAGQMMAIKEDGSMIGTIGGGKPEFMVIEMAKDAILNNQNTFDFSFDLASDGMICGGKIEGFANVLGLGAKLVLFGAGHVNQALARIAKPLGFNIVVIDDRKELVSQFEEVKFISDSYENIIKDSIFNDNSYLVIATRGHQHDREALMYALKTSHAYLGLIGSKRKVKEIYEWALSLGVSKKQLNKVYGPIGLDLADGTPEQIAVSIIAEILMIKNKGSLTHKKDSIVY